MFHVKHWGYISKGTQDNVSRETINPKMLLKFRETFSVKPI
mgnify:CR=1 FL=1